MLSHGIRAGAIKRDAIFFVIDPERPRYSLRLGGISLRDSVTGV